MLKAVLFRPVSYLENEVVLRLQFLVQSGLFDLFLKVHVSLTWHIESWEEIRDQTHEDWQVINDDLGNIEISQSSHQHLVLRTVRVTSLQGTSHHQHRLDGSETPIVMILQSKQNTSQSLSLKSIISLSECT